MRMPLRSPICGLCLLALPLALAACQDKSSAPDKRTAQGEILPGSASDAMLPLDSVRSQPPVAPEEVASGKPERASRKRGSEGPAPDATEAAGPPKPGAGPSIAPDPAAAQ